MYNNLYTIYTNHEFQSKLVKIECKLVPLTTVIKKVKILFNFLVCFLGCIHSWNQILNYLIEHKIIDNGNHTIYIKLLK